MGLAAAEGAQSAQVKTYGFASHLSHIVSTLRPAAPLAPLK